MRRNSTTRRKKTFTLHFHLIIQIYSLKYSKLSKKEKTASGTHRCSDINTVLSIIQECDDIARGSAYTGSAVYISACGRNRSLQQKGAKITHHSDEMVEHIL